MSKSNLKHKPAELPNGWQPIETAPQGIYLLVSAGIARNPAGQNWVIGTMRGRDCIVQFGGGHYMGAKYWQYVPEVIK